MLLSPLKSEKKYTVPRYIMFLAKNDLKNAGDSVVWLLFQNFPCPRLKISKKNWKYFHRRKCVFLQQKLILKNTGDSAVWIHFSNFSRVPYCIRNNCTFALQNACFFLQNVFLNKHTGVSTIWLHFRKKIPGRMPPDPLATPVPWHRRIWAPLPLLNPRSAYELD